MKTKNMTTLHLRKSIGWSPLRLAFLLIPLVLTCFALSPTAHAQLPPPPPDGGYPGNNTAEGDTALFSLTTGTDNTATGFAALNANTTGFNNTATGRNALLLNETGDRNTADGRVALQVNTTGRLNTAAGNAALFQNTTGNFNTATGVVALQGNTTGNLNTALGEAAGQNLTAGDNNIDIGNLGVAAEANTIRIGTQTAGTDVFGAAHPVHTATFIAGISGAGVMGMAVKVNAAGQLGVGPSSQRFKEEIKPMGKASEAILALKPVTFRYKKEIDPDRTPEFGLVAEDVEKVNPDLVLRDKEGKPYTVRYEQVNAMLLNEFLKEHRKVEEQQATIAELKSGMTALAATVKEQASQIQKVSAQLEASKPAPQVVNNPGKPASQVVNNP
jgi:hypothetical protein